MVQLSQCHPLAVQSNRQAAADPTAGLGGGALAPLRAANLHANHCSKILKSPLNLHANQYLYCFSPLVPPPASATVGRGNWTTAGAASFLQSASRRRRPASTRAREARQPPAEVAWRPRTRSAVAALRRPGTTADLPWQSRRPGTDSCRRGGGGLLSTSISRALV